MPDHTEGAPSAPLCTFDEEWRDGRTVIISCVGELDLTTTPELERRIGLALDRSPSAMIVDLSRVDFLASSAMSALIVATERCSPDITLIVVAHGPMTRRPMELVGVTDMLTVHATMDGALRSITT